MFNVNFVFDIESTAQFSTFERYIYPEGIGKLFVNTFVH